MILDSLRNSASFNETDRAIATYLLNHTGDLKTLTMAKLAQETYTSNATIIRFCKKLGLSGYRELIMQLIQEISGDYLLAATVDHNRPFGSTDSIEAIEGNLANLLKGVIDQTKIELDSAKLSIIAKAVLSAPRIYIFAKGGKLSGGMYLPQQSSQARSSCHHGRRRGACRRCTLRTVGPATCFYS